MAEEQRVETVFELVDKASAQAKQMAKTLQDLKTKADEAKKSVAGAGAAPPPQAPGRPAAPGTPAQATFAAAQAEGGFSPEQRAAMRTEKRIERERQWAAREAAEKHQIGGRIVLASAQVFGLSMQGTAGKIVQMGSMMGQIGIELSQFSGKMGKMGAAMGKAGGVMSAFAVGYEVGTFLDETLGLSDALSDWMAGTPSKEEIQRQNNEYARALGYRNSAEYSAASKVRASMDEEVKLQKAVEKYVGDVQALPTNATKQAMLDHNHQIQAAGYKAFKEMGVGPQELAKVVDAMAKQSATTMAQMMEDQTAASDQQIILGDAAKKAGQQLGILPTGATKEAMQAYANKAQKAAELILTETGYAATNMSAVTQMIIQNAQETINATTSMLRQRGAQEIRTETAIEASAKQLKMAPKGMDARIKHDQALVAEAERIAADVYGRDVAAKEIEGIYRELKTKTKREVGRTSFDFRNSNFNIKQAFAEGFDPDRIAVAFANDLASLGERALQSGFAPLFAVR